MSQGYRDELAAAQARVVELEARLSERGHASDLGDLEREHAARVRALPTPKRVWLMSALAAFITLTAVVSMLFLSSPYDHHPRFTLAMQMLTMLGAITSAMLTWVARADGLKAVALSERLLAAERGRAALESRVRVAEQMRVESPDLTDAVAAVEGAAPARARR